MADKGRLHAILSVGIENRAAQEKAKNEAPVAPVAPVGDLMVYDAQETPFARRHTRDVDPSDYVQQYIRKVLENPDRWEQNDLLMLRPKEFDQPRGAPFEAAYRKYEIDQAAAGMRGNAHTTILRAKDQGPIGTLKNLEGGDETVYGVTVQASFVDGDGPSVGVGYSFRIYLQNAAGATLGALFSLSKRNIATYAPEPSDLFYYLFFDLSEKWSMRGAAVKMLPPASVNEGPALWDESLHNAMDFCVYRSISLLYNQFTN